MILYPAVVVYGLDDARTALAPGLPVTLLSGAGAALYAGAGWWQAMIAAARIGFPRTPLCHVLDCADAAGRAMEALGAGLPGLVLDPACPAFAEVAKAALAAGAFLLPQRPIALDLARSHARERLRFWLECRNDMGRWHDYLWDAGVSERSGRCG